MKWRLTIDELYYDKDYKSNENNIEDPEKEIKDLDKF